MAALLNEFQNHTTLTSTHGLSLETIRDNFRHLLANASEEFEFGEFTSVHSILEELLKTGQCVTSSTQQCSSCEHSRGRETDTTSCLVYTFALPGMSLQAHLNDQEQILASSCLMCGQPQVRKTTFQSHPPLIAFQWGVAPPILHTSLRITCRDVTKEYMLQGVIYYANQHFTAHFLDSTSGCWC